MLRQLDKCDPSRDRCPANRADQPNFQVVVDKQALRSFNGVEPNLFGYRHAPTPGCQPRPSLRRRGEGAATYTLQEKVGSGSWATAYSGTAQSKAYSGKASGSYGYRIRACNRSEEHTSELQSLMRISYAVFCLKKKNNKMK